MIFSKISIDIRTYVWYDIDAIKKENIQKRRKEESPVNQEDGSQQTSGK